MADHEQATLAEASSEEDEFDPFKNIDNKSFKLPNGPATLAEADRVFGVDRSA